VATVFAPKKKCQELSILPIAKLSLIKGTNVRKMLQSPCEEVSEVGSGNGGDGVWSLRLDFAVDRPVSFLVQTSDSGINSSLRCISAVSEGIRYPNPKAGAVSEYQAISLDTDFTIPRFLLMGCASPISNEKTSGSNWMVSTQDGPNVRCAAWS
jgi:hypothetical protein